MESYADWIRNITHNVGLNVKVDADTVIELFDLWVDTLIVTLHKLAEFQSTATVIYGLLIIIIGYLLYWLLFKPINRVRDLSDVGYIHLKNADGRKRMKLKDRVNEAIRRHNTGDIPPCFPNGWFVALETRDLAKNQVKPITLFGQNLVAFRDSIGKAHILDAYCPHLGAHLGVGGKVRGNCIECPFHGWQFRGSDGKCTSIPYTEGKIPEIAKVKSWTTREMNEFIFIWYDIEGRQPFWEVPEIDNVTAKTWAYRGRSEHYINAHIQEVPENGGDLAHLACLHTNSFISGNDLNTMNSFLWRWIKHTWRANWRPEPPPNNHIGSLTVEHKLVFFNKFVLFDMDVDVKQIGPGIVYLNFNTPFGPAILFHMVTPIEATHQRVVHQYWSSRSVPAFYGKITLWAEAVQFERDITVWNSKTYLQKPLLVKEDKVIAQHRRWYQQFYSENSIKHRFRKQDGLDW